MPYAESTPNTRVVFGAFGVDLVTFYFMSGFANSTRPIKLPKTEHRELAIHALEKVATRRTRLPKTGRKLNASDILSQLI